MTKTYNIVDRIFALLCLVVGYFFVRWCLFFSAGFGTLAVCVAALILEVVYFILTAKKPFGFKNAVALIVMLVFSAGYAFTSSPLALFFNTLIFAIGSVYVFYRAHSNLIGEKPLDYFFFDVIKAVFVIPFANFGAFFVSIFKKQQDKEVKPSTKYIWIGIAAAILPVIIVTALLCSDSAFSAVLGQIFKFDLSAIFENLTYVNLAIPFAALFFGSVWGNAKFPMPETLSREKADAASEKAKFIPRATTYAAVIPILLVYTAFFASQCVYFVSAFRKILPENFSYSQYARQGFFELCAVCVINFVIITAITVFTKRNEGKEAVFQRILKIMLCIFTEALVVIDIAKMMLYIGQFGLTQKRVVTSWFMILLGLLFLILLLKQFIPKFKITAPSIIVTLVLSAVLIFGNVDACVAKYNVWAYQNDKLESIDIDMMYELDDSAVKYVLPLVYELDYDVYYKAKEYLEYKKGEINRKEFWEYTIHTINAKRLLEDAKIV